MSQNWRYLPGKVTISKEDLENPDPLAIPKYLAQRQAEAQTFWNKLMKVRERYQRRFGKRRRENG